MKTADGVTIDPNDPAFIPVTGPVTEPVPGVPTVYLFSNSPDGDGPAYAMCDDGEIIASHYCSHWGYLYNDLHEWKLSRYKAKYPDGNYQVYVCGKNEIPPPEVVALNYDRRAAAEATARSHE